MTGPFRSRLRSSQVQKTKVHPHRCSSEFEDTSDNKGDHSVNDDPSELITIKYNGNHSVNDDYSRYNSNTLKSSYARNSLLLI